ncbi:MAG: transposase, partial [Bacteroidota bacterium]
MRQDRIRRGSFLDVDSWGAYVDLANEVIAEELTKPFVNRNKWKKYNRLMSAWAKGSLAEALDSVT